MIKKKKCIPMWVAPEFHRKIKSESSNKGISILEYTKQLSEDKIMKKKESKRKVFNYGF